MASALPSELIARIRAASIAAADAEAAEAGGGYQKSRPPSVRIAAGGRVVRAPQKVPAERDVSALRDQRALGRLVRSLEHDGALPRRLSANAAALAVLNAAAITVRVAVVADERRLEFDVAGAVQRAWRKRRQSVDLGAAEGLSEAQI